MYISLSIYIYIYGPDCHFVGTRNFAIWGLSSLPFCVVIVS